MTKKITTLLSKNLIFAGLSSEQIDQILPCIVQQVKTYGSQECVCDKGDQVRDLGVVLDGQLCICNQTPDGKQTPGTNIEPNGLVGDVVVFSTDGNQPHRVVAQDGAEVLYLSGDFFLHQCGKDCTHKETHGEIVKNMLRLLSDKAINLDKKIAYLTAPDLKTKIAMYLCELYEVNRVTTFNMPLNRDRLAEFFSVARPSLSRELINLKNQNVIDFYRSSVKILDVDALYRMAQGE